VEPYPIVTEVHLNPASTNFFGRRQRRSLSDLPRLGASQVAVLRVGNTFLLMKNLDPADEDVIAADLITVVDTTQNRLIPINLPLPSADGDPFRLIVTFACSVHDPVEVVRQGGRDLENKLENYIKARSAIFDAGIEQTMSDVVAVRRNVSAEVVATATIRPPLESGMTLSLSSVEVMTTDEWDAHLRAKVRIERSHKEQSLEAKSRHILESDEQEHNLERTSRMIEKLPDSRSLLLHTYATGQLTGAEALGHSDRADERVHREKLAEREWQEELRAAKRQGQQELIRVLHREGYLDQLDTHELLAQLAPRGEIRSGRGKEPFERAESSASEIEAEPELTAKNRHIDTDAASDDGSVREEDDDY
jgi:hypothetical protein